MQRNSRKIIYALRLLIGLIYIGLIVSCSNEATPKIDTTKQENVSHDFKEKESNQAVTNESFITDIKGEKVKQYKYSNDSLIQTLNVEWVKENTIKFDLFVENKNAKCQVKLSGIAKIRNANFDPEIDIDDDGGGYPSIEYVNQDSNCEIVIRIAMDSRDKVVIKNGDCDQQNTCPLQSVGILKLQNKQ